MIPTSINANDATQLSAVISQLDNAGGAKRAVLRTLVATAAIAKKTEISTSEIFDALAEGTSALGERLLFKTLCVLTRYLSAWGALAILTLGLYQLTQATSATVKWFFSKLRMIAGIGGQLSTVATAFAGIFHDQGAEQDPAPALKLVTRMVTAEIPMIGGILSIFEAADASDMGDPLPITHDTYDQREGEDDDGEEEGSSDFNPYDPQQDTLEPFNPALH